LIVAAGNNHNETLELLMNRGADINMRNKSGETALMWAAGNNHIEAVEMLLERGAKIHARNRSGQTALRLAQKCENQAIAELIRSCAMERKKGGCFSFLSYLYCPYL
jgi:uncharacterized protein